MIVTRAASRRRAVLLATGFAGIVLAACASPVGGSAGPVLADLTIPGSPTTVSTSPATSRSTSAATTRSSAATTTRTSATTSSRTSVGSATRTSATAASGDLVLGPVGWKTLKLDMNESDAAALGMFATMPPTTNDECQAWEAALAAPIESVIISPTFGVVAIQPRAEAGMSTPEGMKIGWSAEQVAAKYSDFSVDDVDTPNGSLVQVPDDPFAFYRLTFADGKLVNFMLESVFQDCYG